MVMFIKERIVRKCPCKIPYIFWDDSMNWLHWIILVVISM